MISVIVPVYNCEQYLDKSIQSLLNQTIFEQLEIIFVNDGSNDNSGEILNNYVSKYKNLKLINQKNGGVSVARNAGIKAASGEFIAFFDSDDFAHNCLYEELLNLLNQENADLSCVNYFMVFSDGVKKTHKHEEKKVLTGEEILVSYFEDDLLCTNPFDKLFKTSIVKEILFPEGYAIGEDMYFVFKYLQLAKKVVIDSTKRLYDYYIRDNSAMQSKFSSKNLQPVELSKKIMDIFKMDSVIYPFAEANYIHEICKSLAIYYKTNSSNKTDFIGSIIEYQSILKQYPFSKAYRFMNMKHFSAFLIMRFSPKLYLFIYKTMHIG